MRLQQLLDSGIDIRRFAQCLGADDAVFKRILESGLDLHQLAASLQNTKKNDDGTYKTSGETFLRLFEGSEGGAA
jgi:hypothetical protein